MSAISGPAGGQSADAQSADDFTADDLAAAGPAADAPTADAPAVGSRVAGETAIEPTIEQVIAATRVWLEKAVIGLKLCPFAAAPHVNDRIRYSVSEARNEADLLDDLSRELQLLQAADPEDCETTLLIHPWVLGNFRRYNEFLAVGDALLVELDLEGELQIASFHPAYRFAGTAAGDIENYTNRSPYPMLHLLREAAVAKAVDNFVGVDDIGARNIQTLRRLGHEGWRQLWLDAK